MPRENTRSKTVSHILFIPLAVRARTEKSQKNLVVARDGQRGRWEG